MTTYILILMILGHPPISVEFDNLEACNKAGTEAVENFTLWNRAAPIFICVEKK